MLKEEIINPRYPHEILIYRVGKKNTGDVSVVDDDDPFAESTPSENGSDSTEERTVLYQGKGRSYTDTTTNRDRKSVV